MPPSVSPDAWFRPLLFQAFIDSAKVETDDLQGAAGNICMDLRAIRALLVEHQHDLSPLDSLLDDLGHLTALFVATCDPSMVMASELGLALSHIETVRPKLVHDVLKAGDLGKSVLASARVLLQESTKDEVANEHMELVMSALDDKRLPTLGTGNYDDGADCEVMNFNMLTTMAVVDVLEGSLNNVEDSLNMWSRPQAERKCAMVNEWLDKLTHTLVLYDECLVTFLQSLTAVGTFWSCLVAIGVGRRRRSKIGGRAREPQPARQAHGHPCDRRDRIGELLRSARHLPQSCSRLGQAEAQHRQGGQGLE